MRFRKVRLTPIQFIVSMYFLAAMVAAVILNLPIFLNEGVSLSIIDGLFVAVSAISVTGLSPISIVDTYNQLGIIVLTFFLQFGGIGLMTISTIVWIVRRKKIGLSQRMLIMTDQNRFEFSGLVRIMMRIVIIICCIELIGTFLLYLRYIDYFPSRGEAFYHAFFASISATTNAGFDITGSSLIPFRNDYYVQSVTMGLLILGSIGFPVLIEVLEWIKRRKDRSFTFSLYTKLTTTTYFILAGVGALGIFLFERLHFLADKTQSEQLFYSLFQSVTTRNGGLATMDVSHFQDVTLLLLCVLMVIGASPSSVGGGIRTTTFAITLLSLYNFVRGRKEVQIFRRQLHKEDIERAFFIVYVAVSICFFSTMLLLMTESFSLLEVLFEVCSAFGTTGLSMGITADLSSFGKIILIGLMFIGRIGILSFVLFLHGGTKKQHFQYPKEKIIIG
ncbi:MAG: TrkH family potassium uptake protein [Bacilli bacterium]